MARIADTVTLFFRPRDGTDGGETRMRLMNETVDMSEELSASAGNMAQTGTAWCEQLVRRMKTWTRLKGVGGRLGIRAPYLAKLAIRAVASAAEDASRVNLNRLMRAAETTAARDDALRRVAALGGIDANSERALLWDAAMKRASQQFGVPFEIVADTAANLLSEGFSDDTFVSGGSLDEMLSMMAAFGRLRSQPGHSAQHEVRAAATMLASWGQKKNADNLRALSSMAYGLHQTTPLSLHDLVQAAGEANALRLVANVPPREQLAYLATLLRVQRGQRVPIQLRRFVTSLASAAANPDRKRALRGLGIKPDDVDLIGEDLGTVIKLLIDKQKGLLKGTPENIVDGVHSVLARAEQALQADPDPSAVIRFLRDHTMIGQLPGLARESVRKAKRALWDAGPLTQADYNERLNLLFGIKTMPGAVALLRDFELLYAEMLDKTKNPSLYDQAVKTAVTGPVATAERADEFEAQTHVDKAAAKIAVIATLMRAEAMGKVPQVIADRLRERFLELASDPLFNTELDESLRLAAEGRSAIPMLFSRIMSGDIVLDAASQHVYHEKLAAAIQRALVRVTRSLTLPPPPDDTRKKFGELLRKYPRGVWGISQMPIGAWWLKNVFGELGRTGGTPEQIAKIEQALQRMDDVVRMIPPKFFDGELLRPEHRAMLPRIRIRAGNFEFFEAAQMYVMGDNDAVVNRESFNVAWEARRREKERAQIDWDDMRTLDNPARFDPYALRADPDHEWNPLARPRLYVRGLPETSPQRRVAEKQLAVLEREVKKFTREVDDNREYLEKTRPERERGEHVPLPAPPDDKPARDAYQKFLNDLREEYKRQIDLGQRGSPRRVRVSHRGNELFGHYTMMG